MSSNTIIYYNDLVPDCTLTTSGETATYEKEYAQDWTPQNIWQGDAAASTLSMNYAAAVKQEAIWVGGTNFTSAMTTFKYGEGAAAAANTYEVNLDKEASAFSELNSTPAYRYGKLTTTVAAGLPEVGKVYVAGSKFILDKDIRRGYTGGTMSEFITNKGRYGQVHREIQYSKVIYSFDMIGINDAQKEILDETIRKEENVIFWDGELQKAFFGVVNFSQPKFIRSNMYGAIWQMSGTFEEAK